jgi:transcriptional regulator with XRE-family HTH domain
MNLKPLPEDLAVLIRLLRAWRDWTQQQLAEAAGIASNSLRRYEAGTTIPGRAVVERIAAAVKVPLFVVDFFLLPGIAAERQARGWADLDMVAAIFRRLALRLERFGRLLAGAPSGLGEGREDPQGCWSPAEAVRERALALWKELEGCDDKERRSLVDGWREYQHPGLAELLCHLSEEAASDRADRALALAELAHRVAELAPGYPAEKKRLLGYTLIFLANAVRVAGKLREARERFQEGLASWLAGDGRAAFLEKWRVLEREASLLRDERRFPLALNRLDKAAYFAPPENTGRILLSKSAVSEQMGEGEWALEELRKAERHIDRESDPRLFLVLRFNLATSLCLLDQFEEAEGMYPEIQDLAAVLQKELDNVRLKWLAGRIAAGRGRLDEAAAALDEVRQEFTRKLSVWDCSLVTLELATVRLRQGRAAEVRPLALALVRIFEAQGIHEEALGALALFRDAVERDEATPDLTERLVRYLRKAQGDPGLRFLG